MGKSRNMIRVLVRREKLVNRQPCFGGNALQNLRGRRVNAVHEVRDRRLAYADTLGEIALRRLRSVQVRSQCSHMSNEGIGFAYDSAIGQSYFGLPENWAMPKHAERSFLERAMEALQERYPREKPSQTKLAKLAGVAQPSVNDWKEIDRGPAMKTGIRLAKALGVCVEWLYTERGAKRPVDAAPADEHLSPILQAWPDLDPALKRQIARYTDFVKDDKQQK